MKVLMINGSPREKQCTYTALSIMAERFAELGIETEIVQLGNGPIRDCIACRKCRERDDGKCFLDGDIINEIIEKAKSADGFVFGSPVYYSHPSGRILSVLDRVFFAGTEAFAFKPGAAIVSARRGGNSASFDVLNKYFTIAQMPVATSTYWNMVHGNTPEEVMQDAEGVQTMKNLASNMAWMMRCIEAGKSQGIEHPDNPEIATNFIR